MRVHSSQCRDVSKHLAYGYLANDFGGLVLCAKKEERRQWEKWAAKCDRTDDLIIVDSSGKRRFNFIKRCRFLGKNRL